MNGMQEITPDRQKHAKSPEPRVTPETNNGANMPSDTQDLNELDEEKTLTVDVLLQHIQGLGEALKEQAVQISDHMEHIQALEQRIQELEGRAAPTTIEQSPLPEIAQLAKPDNIEDEDQRPTAPVPALPPLFLMETAALETDTSSEVATQAPTMPLPLSSDMTSRTPTMPLSASLDAPPEITIKEEQKPDTSVHYVPPIPPKPQKEAMIPGNDRSARSYRPPILPKSQKETVLVASPNSMHRGLYWFMVLLVAAVLIGGSIIWFASAYGKPW